MRSYKKKSAAEHVPKTDASDNPVNVCKGWSDPCDYCDKRFGEWRIPSADNPIRETIPESRPGFVMVALKSSSKNVTEVVSLSYEPLDVRKSAILHADAVRERISNKRIKATKSVVVFRWMDASQVGEKDSVVLCCHWYNSGVLPRYQTAWPGLDLMGKSQDVFFSERIQKWCHRQKSPVWRKVKPPPSMEEVPTCDFQSCEICDSYFTRWRSLAEVVEQDSAPEDKGLVMLSVFHGGERQVVGVYSKNDVVVSEIKRTVLSYHGDETYYVRKSSKLGNKKNATLQVRWTLMKKIDSSNSCFLFAHFHNCEEWPPMNACCRTFSSEINELGAKTLNESKNFVFLGGCKKWFKIEAIRSSKVCRAKNRKQMLDELCTEEDYETEQS